MNPNDYPKIQVRVSEVEKKRFQILKDAGFSAREIIEIVFDKCFIESITVMDKKTREPVQIPPNILIKRKDY